ncbi:hypothetical protein SCATT_11270 [Streptantibioticus cattleyicolor NRRL 8057 = DSM 46488]|uniref:Uncharacterized protein n=1 Tax=Streptantibioticus cattleyicolor (strain ATCC 35852 / DSM 46488 / JCM 4925 / NBRC 14057 / NRRL 8057) TaxID=1003195 RepID=G8WPZ7_STREN|nr:hypothetical protein SCATT_11270 [Streptantibioticus cattleyicolor NRRL 8057 = DSM 46488]
MVKRRVLDHRGARRTLIGDLAGEVCAGLGRSVPGVLFAH